MTEMTNKILFAILKSIELRMDGLEHSPKELVLAQLRIREGLNSFHGDAIRHEAQVAEIAIRLDRIDAVLDRKDARTLPAA